MPTLPPVRVAIHYTAGSGSAPPVLPSPAARSVVVGNAGGLPVPGFKFDGDAAGYLDETLAARLEPEHCSLATDLTTLYRSVRLTGGAATLLPDGARITGMAVICGGYTLGGPYGFPLMSQDRDLVTDSLCVIAVDADAGGAGLYYWTAPGELYRFPQTVQAPHLCLTQADGVFFVGTPHGCYSRSADPTDTTSRWQRVGAFARRVTRIEPRATADEEPVLILWSLVQDRSGGKIFDGVYRRPGYDAAAFSAEIEGDWQPVVRAGELVDMVPSGPDDVWYIAKSDPETVHHLVLDSGAGTATDTAMPLPSGSQGTRLSYVLGPPSHPVSAVYCSVAGADSPLYYTVDGGGGSWSDFADADTAGNLRDPLGNVVGVNAVVPSGLTLLGWESGALTGDAGAYVAAWAATTTGLFWCPAIGGSAGGGVWQAVSGSSGLDDVSVGNVAAGQWISLLGQPANRVFVTNSERLYVSHTSTNLWEEAAPHAALTVGPALSAVVYKTTGRLLDNMVKTVGGTTGSPIGDDPNTHAHVPGLLPDGWWFQRSLNQYRAFEWALVNGAVTTPRSVAQQVSDLAAESSSRVALLSASNRLVETSVTFLGEHSTPRVDLTMQTTFTSAEAAARRLRATMQVPVRYHGQMLARSSAGDALTTVYLALDDALFFVTSVKFEASSELGPGACTCTVALSTSLSEDRSADQIAGALIEQNRNAHKKHRH